MYQSGTSINWGEQLRRRPTMTLAWTISQALGLTEVSPTNCSPYRRNTMESTSPALSLGLTLAIALIGLTGFSIYTAFGPPAKDLADPFEDHED